MTSAGGGGSAGLGGSISSAAANVAGTPAGGSSGSAPASGGSVQSAGSAGTPIAGEAPFQLVATEHNDAARTGANLSETTLDTSNVNLSRFGELSRRAVRGAIFAQPLVVPRVRLTGGATFDVVIVATMANVVYALDAHHPENPPLWSRTLAPPIQLPDPLIPAGSAQIWHEVGVLGTPVISVEHGSLYAVAASKVADVYRHYLFKLDLASGNLASVGIEHEGFVSEAQMQKSALTLANDVIYVPFGAYDPRSSASGWVFAYDTELNALGGVMLGSPSGAHVTMGGHGPAADGTSVFFTTGPGASAIPDSSSFGSRLLELRAPSTSGVSERLFPSAARMTGTNELASSGPVLIPESNRVVTLGQHRVYVLARGVSSDSSGASLVQTFRPSGPGICEQIAQSCESEPGSPIFWPGSGPEPQARLIVWPIDDTLRAFGFDASSARFDCPDETPDIQCQSLPANTAPDATKDSENGKLQTAANLSVSSNASERGTGIVWAAHAYNRDPLHNPDGILRAFAADDLSQLWSSRDAGTPVGPSAPGVAPTVSGGRVFMATAEGLFEKAVFWSENIEGTPALANFDDRFLVAAWGSRSGPTPGFQIEWSDGGVTFTSGGFLPDDFASAEPALAFGGSRLYLAYTAANGTVKVAAASHPSFTKPSYLTQQTGAANAVALDYAATTSPALAYGNGRLFLAFNQDSRICILSSADGSSFDTASLVTVAAPPSAEAPLLSYVNGKLYLISRSNAHELSLFVSSNDGGTFDGSTTLPVKSTGHPALLAFDLQPSGESELLLAWSDSNPGNNDDGRIKLGSFADANFNELSRIHALQAEQAQFSISAARFKGAWYLAWLGIAGATHPNVARYTPGELVTYGLKAR